MKSAFGSFGPHLDDVVRTDFYTFFYLAPFERRANGDGTTTVRHKPSHSFREDVDFDVMVDVSGLLRELTLTVARTFLDSPRNGGFARDIVRSLIVGALANGADADTVADLLTDLQSRPHAGQPRDLAPPSGADALLSDLIRQVDRGEAASVDFGARAVDPGSLPEVSSRGYAVYLGERASYRRDLSSAVLQMTNEGDGDERRLVIRLTRHDI